MAVAVPDLWQAVRKPEVAVTRGVRVVRFHLLLRITRIYCFCKRFAGVIRKRHVHLYLQRDPGNGPS